MNIAVHPVGDHLRTWRRRRRMSQLDLALEADISSRHLSFVETGRSTPSREMILNLAEQLDIPVRERNILLVAAGYAPLFPERSLASPDLAAARAAIELLLEGLKPFPALAVDRAWNMVATNGALPQLYEGVAPHLLEPSVNVIRLSLSPEGLAPRIVNLEAWRAHVLARLRRQIDLTADPALIALMEEVGGASRRADGTGHGGEMVATLHLRLGDEVLSFFTATMMFGTPLEVTLSELALESFLPADAQTDAAVRALARG